MDPPWFLCCLDATLFMATVAAATVRPFGGIAMLRTKSTFSVSRHSVALARTRIDGLGRLINGAVDRPPSARCPSAGSHGGHPSSARGGSTRERAT